MQRETPLRAVERLLEETGQAHHAAFSAVDGDDPEWPLWYAKHVHESLSDTLGTPLTQTRTVCLLVTLASEHEAHGPDDPWPRFYAKQLVERFVPEPEEQLFLYIMRGCPFCSRVQAVIEQLGIQVELRDVREDPAALKDLIDARGRATVPVLRCTAGDVDRWMPESADIIRYLERRFGDKAA